MGMSMSANKHKNIRAALCYSVKNAKLSRLHNDANVITLGERLISKNLAFKCINAFLNTCLLYTSPSPRDRTRSRMPSSA